MKKLFLLSCVMFSFVFLGAQSIDFDSKVMDYGTIAHNSDGLREFKFVNNGTKQLVIKNAKGSCGCTVPSYKKKDGSSEWAPGESGTIQVKYATNRIGKFTKTITLTTNTPDNRPVILTIKGEVLSPEQDSGMPRKNTKGSPLEGK